MGAIDYLTEPVSEARLSEALKRAKKHIKSSVLDIEYVRAAEEFFSGFLPSDTEDKFIRKNWKEGTAQETGISDADYQITRMPQTVSASTRTTSAGSSSRNSA